MIRAMLLAGLVLAGSGIAYAQQAPPIAIPVLTASVTLDSPYRISQKADVDTSGVVNSIDLQLVAVQYGFVYDPPPCVPYDVFTDAHPGPEAINSLGEPVAPRGATMLVPASHPAYEALLSGQPAFVAPCAPHD